MYVSLLAVAALAVATPTPYDARPYAGVAKRQTSYSSSDLEVDLGYSVYQGYNNATAGLNVFQGIRFAAPPTGNLRWQAPQAPEQNRSATIHANEYAPTCPQSPDASTMIVPVNQTLASEDCLFLNVWTPSNASGPLPVYFEIHGGGYGAGSGRQDLTALINTNGNAFVGVTIQYRLGAFGFLSSDEVYRKGTANAGILDQHLALQVTISGESAGGGSVMLQDMAYGGTLGTQLFQNSIVASPYSPMQYGYKDWIPTQSYFAFADAVGCAPARPYLANGSQPIFECLVSKDTDTLINASATVSEEGSNGTWAFLPVTDGSFVQDLPSRQLKQGKVNGLNMLAGNNANEGVGFVTQTIETEDDLVNWLSVTFPLFSNNDIAKLLFYYPSTNASVDPNAPLFATDGEMAPTALNQSSVGTGQQQRADNIYAETTFVCPSYWLAEAYSNNKRGGQAYKYQFSVPPATHGADVAGYYDYPGQMYSADFTTAFQRVYGNYVTQSNPSISSSIASGMNAAGNVSTNAATDWPPFTLYAPYQLDLNTTCPIQTEVNGLVQCNSTQQVNDFTLVNAYTWEGGRGTRCDFWRAMGELVPE